MSVRVKICGVRTPDAAAAAVESGADAIGLNFHPGSKRFVGSTAAAARIAAAVPERVWCVGVFVDASREAIAEAVRRVPLSAIQLHGDEPAELETGWTVPVIRAVRMGTAGPSRRPDEILAGYVLCDGDAGAACGGAAVGFDWKRAKVFPRERLFVAGGLTPENVAEAVRVVRPFAVDVATGVESSPGVKDRARVAEFVKNAKSA